MMMLRKLHLVVGFTLVPFLFVTAVTGIVYLLVPRMYQVLKWHGWFRWGGVMLALGLVFLALSGAALYMNMRVQQWKRKAKTSVGSAAR